MKALLRKWFGWLRVPEPEVDYEKYQCTCHQNMGEAFFLLPLDQCERGKCNFRTRRIVKWERPF